MNPSKFWPGLLIFMKNCCQHVTPQMIMQKICNWSGSREYLQQSYSERDFVVDEANSIQICNKSIQRKSFFLYLRSFLSIEQMIESVIRKWWIKKFPGAMTLSWYVWCPTPRKRQEYEQEEESKHHKALAQKCIC